MKQTIQQLIDHLEKCALEATPGYWMSDGTNAMPWEITSEFGWFEDEDERHKVCSLDVGDEIGRRYGHVLADARHIAANSPDNTLRLIAYVRELQAEVERHREGRPKPKRMNPADNLIGNFRARGKPWRVIVHSSETWGQTFIAGICDADRPSIAFTSASAKYNGGTVERDAEGFIIRCREEVQFPGKARVLALLSADAPPETLNLDDHFVTLPWQVMVDYRAEDGLFLDLAGHVEGAVVYTLDATYQCGGTSKLDEKGQTTRTHGDPHIATLAREIAKMSERAVAETPEN